MAIFWMIQPPLENPRFRGPRWLHHPTQQVRRHLGPMGPAVSDGCGPRGLPPTLQEGPSLGAPWIPSESSVSWGVHPENDRQLTTKWPKHGDSSDDPTKMAISTNTKKEWPKNTTNWLVIFRICSHWIYWISGYRRTWPIRVWARHSNSSKLAGLTLNMTSHLWDDWDLYSWARPTLNILEPDPHWTFAADCWGGHLFAYQERPTTVRCRGVDCPLNIWAISIHFLYGTIKSLESNPVFGWYTSPVFVA